MGLFPDKDRKVAVAVSRLITRNPFLPEWLEHERNALAAAGIRVDGDDGAPAVWSMRMDADVERPEVEQIVRAVERVVDAARARLLEGVAASEGDLRVYTDAVLYLVYHVVRHHLFEAIHQGESDPGSASAHAARQFPRLQETVDHYLQPDDRELPGVTDAAHIFALCFQIRRAFHHIYRFVIGGSMATARLRAAIWQSVFTHDMHRYMRSLYNRTNDITTLIVGESGTGKEVVARAIGLSRYIPFHASRKTFEDELDSLFLPLNISALSEQLIESELFGHRRGAFTGALEDRTGWLETCRPLGCVFLDEIGEVSPEVQVKLLRVLQTRRFQRLGDTEPRAFRGKFIAATNRDLAGEIEQGRFRADFFYRLCSDLIVTPSLTAQLQDAPDELENIVRFIARRVAGPAEAVQLTDEVVTYIQQHLADHSWPGNFRELEQCTRNVLIRGEYHPPTRRTPPADTDGATGLARDMAAGRLTVDDLTRHYCTIVYAQTGSYQETARRIGLDRRTVKSRVDEALLARLQGRTTDSAAADPDEA